MPALVLFSIGGIAATVGTPSVLVWTLSVLFGFIQAFTYAEIAGLYPGKSGGAPIYGAVAWVRYFKFIAPTSVWSYWFAWSPVLAIGSGLGAGYILSLFFAPDATINTWQITLLDLGSVKEGLTLRINATFFIGARFAILRDVFLAAFFVAFFIALRAVFLTLRAVFFFVTFFLAMMRSRGPRLTRGVRCRGLRPAAEELARPQPGTYSFRYACARATVARIPAMPFATESAVSESVGK